MSWFGRSRQLPVPLEPPPDPVELDRARAALEQGHRKYVEAVHVAAHAEHTSRRLIRARDRNHIGPAVGDMYRRDR